MKRRSFIKTCAALAGAGCLPVAAAETPVASAPRDFHLSLNTEVLEEHPDLLDTVAEAGTSKIWLAAYLYGHWPYPHEERRAWTRRIEARGIAVDPITVPLGHPGDSLGSMHGNIPLTPPEHWRMATLHDGRLQAGTSIHPPATGENCEAVRLLADEGCRQIFLDDDFRLANAPGTIGGCFCDEHKAAFLKSRGFGEAEWAELREAVANRSVCRVLREWVAFTCDELTASFRAQQAAVPGVELGNMVMYMGSEKAGIRLDDYRGVPFRVGELMFSDTSFGTVKGKADELFSALFHRRFTPPELAWSETTAFPPDQLSARNLAAKLVVSTITDTRHTMYMSGLSPFPAAYWDTLAPAMQRQAALHAAVAGHAPHGPLKHFWGEHSRLAGNDDPYSLFLALGVPFGVCDAFPEDGWVFLSDADARGVSEGGIKPAGARIVARNDGPGDVRGVPEKLEALFALKREILPALGDTPRVVEEKPVVCAWYPTAGKVLLWNLSEQDETYTLRQGLDDRTVPVPALDAAVVEM